MEILNALADIAGIISLFLSGFIVFKVRNIQNNSQSGKQNRTANQQATGSDISQRVTQ